MPAARTAPGPGAAAGPGAAQTGFTSRPEPESVNPQPAKRAPIGPESLGPESLTSKLETLDFTGPQPVYKPPAGEPAAPSFATPQLSPSEPTGAHKPAADFAAPGAPTTEQRFEPEAFLTTPSDVPAAPMAEPAAASGITPALAPVTPAPAPVTPAPAPFTPAPAQRMEAARPLAPSEPAGFTSAEPASPVPPIERSPAEVTSFVPPSDVPAFGLPEAAQPIAQAGREGALSVGTADAGESVQGAISDDSRAAAEDREGESSGGDRPRPLAVDAAVPVSASSDARDFDPVADLGLTDIRPAPARSEPSHGRAESSPATAEAEPAVARSGPAVGARPAAAPAADENLYSEAANDGTPVEAESAAAATAYRTTAYDAEHAEEADHAEEAEHAEEPESDDIEESAGLPRIEQRAEVPVRVYVAERLVKPRRKARRRLEDFEFLGSGPVNHPVALAAAGVVLTIVLLLQTALWFRSDIVGRFPEAQGALDALCQPIHCKAEWPRKIDDLVIDASDLRSEDGILTLTATLRNRGSLMLALPTIELTITDDRGDPLALRRLSPADYLGEKLATTDGIAAGSELSLSVHIDGAQLAASGYRLLVLYA
jgi:hypothetical protein